MKMRTMFLAAAMLAAVLPARAQQLDLSTIKCSEFVTGDKETIGLILMWLEGFYADEDAKPVVDFDAMKKNGEKLGAYCARNPGHSLITAADDVME